MSRWYIVKQGKADGPHETVIVKKMIDSGGLSSSDYIFKVGDPDWKQVKDQSDLKDTSATVGANSSLGGAAGQAVVEGVSLGGASSQDDQWVLLIKQPPGSKEKFAQSGPFSKQHICSQLQSGSVSDGDFVWKQGFKQWARLRDLPEFRSQIKAQPGEPLQALTPLTAEEEVTAKKFLDDVLEKEKTGKFEMLRFEAESTAPGAASGPNMAASFPSGMDTLDSAPEGATRVTPQAFIPLKSQIQSSPIHSVEAASSPVKGSQTLEVPQSSAGTSSMEFERTRVGASIMPQAAPASAKKEAVTAESQPMSIRPMKTQDVAEAPGAKAPSRLELAEQGIHLSGEDEPQTLKKKFRGLKFSLPKKFSVPRLKKGRGDEERPILAGESTDPGVGGIKPRRNKTAVGAMLIVALAIGGLLYFDLVEKGGESSVATSQRVRHPQSEPEKPAPAVQAADHANTQGATPAQGGGGTNPNSMPAGVAATTPATTGQPQANPLPQNPASQNAVTQSQNVAPIAAAQPVDPAVAGIQELPPGGPLKIRIVPLKLTGTQPQIAFETNAPVQTPIEVRVVGRSGQILGNLAFDRTEKITRAPGELPVLNLESWKLSPGNYQVVARAGETVDKLRIFIGLNDLSFQTSLNEHRKQISYQQQQERHAIRQLARQYSVHAKALLVASKQNAKNPKAWSKFYGAWQKEGKKLKGRLPGSSGGEVAFPTLAKEFSKQIELLEGQGQSFNEMIRQRKVQPRGIASTGFTGFARIHSESYKIKGR